MIRNRQKFLELTPAGWDGAFYWDFLLPAFKETKIAPMDLDFIIERKGHFFVIESKSPGTPVPKGQKITLESLLSLGNFIVVILPCKRREDVDGWELWYWKKNKVIRVAVRGDANSLLEFLSDWFNCASGKQVKFPMPKGNKIN